MWDYNAMVDVVNSIIDKLEAKRETTEVIITREVKDYKFFNWEEVRLPYSCRYTLLTLDDANKVFGSYVLTYKEMNNINNLLLQNNIVSLLVEVKEEMSKKEEKQEVMFETVESISKDEPIVTGKKKRGRKAKTKRE